MVFSYLEKLKGPTIGTQTTKSAAPARKTYSDGSLFTFYSSKSGISTSTSYSGTTKNSSSVNIYGNSYTGTNSKPAANADSSSFIQGLLNYGGTTQKTSQTTSNIKSPVIYQNNKLDQATELCKQFFSQTGKQDLLATMQNVNISGGYLPETTLGRLENGSKVLVNNNLIRTASAEKVASIIAHEVGHANDKDLVNSITEERDMFMLSEELMDFYGKGEYQKTGTALASEIEGLVKKAYGMDGLNETSSGHTGKLIYST